MLIVEYHDTFGTVKRVPASRVLVYDGFGNPYVAAIAHDAFIITGTNDNPVAFEKLLHEMGLHHTVVVDSLSQPREPMIR